MVALLKEGGGEIVHHKQRGIGHTAMHWAASRGERGLMGWLLGLGADIDARNASETTPLHAAAGGGQAFAVEWLLAHGAATDLQNDDGKTAADVARGRDRPDLATQIENYEHKPADAKEGGAAAGGGAQAPPHEEEVD